MKYIFSVIFTFLVLPISAQEALEIKIQNITFSDTTATRNFYHKGIIAETEAVNERKFSVVFNLKNASEKTIRFLYNDAEFENIGFRVYQEEKVVAAFLTKEGRENSLKYFLGAPPAEEPEREMPEREINAEERFHNSLFTLSPGQEWQFTQVFYWNKNQPNRKANNQGYVDAGFPHYLELSVRLGKLYNRQWMNERDFDSIKSDENFIEGTFTSEKAAINFD